MSGLARVRATLAVALLSIAPGARGEDAAPAFGEELVVQGQRTRPSDATAATTVVDARSFAGEAKTVAELVSTAPGVAVNGYGGLGQVSTISIRGSSAAEVPIFLDGLLLGDSTGGGVDLSRIPHAWIERIEIVRGAAGATYGPGALGGAVNVVTTRGVAGSWSASATAGEFATVSASATGAAGGDGWTLLAAGAFDDTGGRFPYSYDTQPSLPGGWEARERTHNAATSGGGLAKLRLDLGAGRLDAIAQLSGGARDLPGTPAHPTPHDWQRDARAAAVVRYARPLSDALDLALDATVRDDRLDVAVSPSAGASSTPVLSRQRDLAGTASARLAWSAGPSVLTVAAGGNAERLDVEGKPGQDRAGAWVALSDELAVAGGAVRLAPALRWDVQGPFDGVSARLGATWQASPVVSVRAGGGRAFRVPSFGELYVEQALLAPNPDLVPEQGWSADAAVVGEGRLGLASVGVFTQLYEELVVYEQESLGRMKPFNDGKASASGVEVELASAPRGPAALSVSGAYTYLVTETLRGDAGAIGKQLPHRAPHRLFARVAAAPGPVEAHVEAHWLSGQYLDLENQVSQYVGPALTLNVGAAVRLRANPDTRLDLEIRNLLDDRTLQDGYGNPLPGRMLLVTFRIAG